MTVTESYYTLPPRVVYPQVVNSENHTMLSEALPRYVQTKFSPEQKRALVEAVVLSCPIIVKGIYPGDVDKYIEAEGFECVGNALVRPPRRDKTYNVHRPLLVWVRNKSKEECKHLWIIAFPSREYVDQVGELVRYFIDNCISGFDSLSKFERRDVLVHHFDRLENEIAIWTGLSDAISELDVEECAVVLGHFDELSDILSHMSGVEKVRARVNLGVHNIYSIEEFAVVNEYTAKPERLILLGFEHCFWGSASAFIARAFVDSGANHIIYIAKGGTLIDKDVLHKTLAPRGYLLVPAYDEKPEEISIAESPLRQYLVEGVEKSGWHITVPTVIGETLEQRKIYKNYSPSSVDDEAGFIVKELTRSDSESGRHSAFSAFYFLTDYLRRGVSDPDAGGSDLSVVGDVTVEMRKRESFKCAVRTVVRYLKEKKNEESDPCNVDFGADFEKYISDVQQLTDDQDEIIFKSNLLYDPDDPVRIFYGAGRELTLDDFSGIMTSSRRTLLQGEGGVGKTRFVRRLAVQSILQGKVPIYVNLGNVSAKEIPIKFEDILRWSAVPLDAEKYNRWASQKPPLVVVDNLNRWREDHQDHLLDLFEHKVTQDENVLFIVVDRLNEKHCIGRPGWVKVRYGEQKEAEVQRIVNNTGHSEVYQGSLDYTRGLLRKPFFLNLFLRTNNIDIDRFIGDHVGLSELESQGVGMRLFEEYRRKYEGDKRDPEGLIVVRHDDKAFEKLITSGVVSRNKPSGKNGVYFEHQLFEDYFLGHWLVADSTRWTYSNLNIVTADGGAIDVLVLALGEMKDKNVADAYVRALYDWQFRLASLVLRRVHEISQRSPISKGLYAQILFSVGEKLHDRSPRSRYAAISELRDHPSELAIEILKTRSIEELLTLMHESTGNEKGLVRWKSIFSASREINPGGGLEDYVDALSDDDPLVGWGAANSLRRQAIDDRTLVNILNLLRSEEPAVRWRSVHVLGVVPTFDVIDELLAVLNDPEERLRVGTVRSLMEICSSNRRLIPYVVERIREDSISASRGMFLKVIHMLDVDEDRREWSTAIFPLVRVLLAKKGNSEIKEELYSSYLRIHEETQQPET